MCALRFIVSALWRHHYGRVLLGSVLLLCLVLGITVNVWLAYGLWFTVAGLVQWEGMAKFLAERRGFHALYVLPSPPGWGARRLRDLGYQGPVASRLWEMHVNESHRWKTNDGTSTEAVRRFQTAYAQDRARWLQERPDDVGLLITTFNQLPEAQRRALTAAGAWIYAGALTPALPAVVFRRRMEATQRRMFGRVVASRDRTNPTEWTTVYVPARDVLDFTKPNMGGV